MSIFKEYDIRGAYPEEIDEDLAEKLGLAFSQYLVSREINNKKVVVGHDARQSSHVLCSALIGGLNKAGLKVDFIHQVSTDVLYQAVAASESAGGIMVTASHNSPTDNGFKLVTNQVEVIGGKELQKIKQIITEKKFFLTDEPAEVKINNTLLEFVDFTLSQIEIPDLSGLSLVVDFGNSFSKLAFERIKERLNLSAKYLNENLGNDFSGRGPNPTGHLQDLSGLVKKEKADLGIAWDGDGDRIVFTDETGQVISGDSIFILLANEWLSSGHTGKIVYDLRLSRDIKDNFGELDNLIISRAGRSYIEINMKKNQAIFGGEPSGHFFYQFKSSDFYWYAENTFLSMLLILKQLKNSQKKMSELVKKVKHWHKAEEVNFSGLDWTKNFNDLKEFYQDGKQVELDGLTIEYSDWWFNLRPSNTENLVRLNLEANSKELLEEKLEEITNVIKN